MMFTVPTDERLVTDEEVFAAFDLTIPELKKVSDAIHDQNILLAKQELVRYFETRQNVCYVYDYRSLPLMPIDTDEDTGKFQAALGLKGSLKEFCLYSGRKMMDHIYVRPGSAGKETDLGPGYEHLPHFNYYEDQGKKHRTDLDIFVRGTFFEYLAVLYHETGDPKVLQSFEETLLMFFEHYPLIIECQDPDAHHFSFTEERDVMSAGFLTLGYVSLLYTRVPYDLSADLAFEIIKRIWYLGVQVRRFDYEVYYPYNHHMWERGLVPFILGTLLPEIPAFASVKPLGANVIRRHIMDDFNEWGGYSEHSIPYWSGAALREMICKGILLARLNQENLLDEETRNRIDRSFDILALISPPHASYPSLGDGGGPLVNAVLYAGWRTMGSRYCEDILDIRLHGAVLPPSLPLDYSSHKTGFYCSKSGYAPDSDYILMSAKTDCGRSGHNHMDMLTLFISMGGQEFIGEPHARQLYHTVPQGTPNRGYLYNMGSHNTVLVHGSPVQPDRMFANKWGVFRPDSPIAEFHSDVNGSFVSAFHDAYSFCRHTRDILFSRSGGILISDRLRGGDRVSDSHIQRWHLFPDVTYQQLDQRTLVLQKNGIRILCMWTGSPTLHIWQKEELCPVSVTNREVLSTIIDVAFAAETDASYGDAGLVQQSLLILNVTDKTPDVPDRDMLCRSLMDTARGGDPAGALKLFLTIPSGKEL